MNKFLNQIKLASSFYKAIYILGFLVAVTLPLYAGLSSVLLYVFLSVIFIFRGKYIVNKRSLRSISWSTTTVLLYLIPVLAIAFSDSLYDSTKALGKYLLYLLMPLALICIENKERRVLLDKMKKGWIIGALIASIILLITLGIRIGNNPEPFQIHTILNYYHTYYNFTTVLSKHPTYIGAEIFLAIVFLFHYLISSSRTFLHILGGISLLLMSLCLVFINSRVVLSIFILSFLIILLKYMIRWIRSGQIIRVSVLLFSFVAASFLIYKTISKTYVFHRYTHELSWELSNEVGTNFNSTISSDSRVARWNSAVKLIKKKWILGYGNNSEKRELYQQYEKDGLFYAMENRYDAHNIYLAYFIEYGVWGFFILLLFIYQNFNRAYKQKCFDSFFLILMITILGFSENYLKTSEGILLTVLFINSLALQKNKTFCKQPF